MYVVHQERIKLSHRNGSQEEKVATDVVANDRQSRFRQSTVRDASKRGTYANVTMHDQGDTEDAIQKRVGRTAGNECGASDRN